MGKDYEALKLFNKKNKYNSPYFSILSFIVFPIFLIQTASFEEIIQYIGVCLSFFSVLVVMGLSILRRKNIEKGVFKLPFANLISALFVIINLWMIYHLISNDLRILLYVLFTILLGLCFYLLINFIKTNK